MFASEVVDRRVSARVTDFPIGLSLDEIKHISVRLTEANDWTGACALGLVTRDRFPGRAIGHILVFDSLSKLNLRKDAEIALKLALAGDCAAHPILELRYAQMLNRRHAYLDLASFGLTCAIEQKVLEIAYSAAITIRNFALARQIAGRAPEWTAPDIRHQEKNWDDLITLLPKERSQLLSMARGEEKETSKQREAAIWMLFSLGVTDLEAALCMTECIDGEFEYHARPTFFRQYAYRLHPDNETIALRLANSLCFLRLIDDAYEVLAPFLSSTRNAQTIRVTRNLGITLGRLPDFSDRADSNIAAVELLRKANRSKWQGHETTHATALLSLAQLSSPIIRKISDMAEWPDARSVSSPARATVAVCISGQLRNYAANWRSTVENIIKPLEADVFVHTWDTQVQTPPLFRRLARFIGSDLTNLLPQHYRQTSQFSKRFPATARKLQQKITAPVDRATFDPEIVTDLVIEREDVFEKWASSKPHLRHRGNHNQIKMFHKMHACDALRRSHELRTGKNYDVVIRLRPDLTITTDNLPDFIDDAFRNPGRVYVNYINPDGVGDQFAFGTGQTMKAFTSAFEFLNSYGRFDYLPGSSGQPAENLVGEHAYAMGLEVRLLPVIEQDLSADLAIRYHDISGELEQDLGTADRSEFEPFLNGYRLWKDQRFSQSSAEKEYTFN